MHVIYYNKKKYSMNTTKPSEDAMTRVFQQRTKIGKYISLSDEIKKILNMCYLSVLF